MVALRLMSASAPLWIEAYCPNAAIATMNPQRPQRCSRAAAKTIAVPIMVTQIDVSQPWCGGDATVTSNPYRPCHHSSHSPYSRNEAAAMPPTR